MLGALLAVSLTQAAVTPPEPPAPADAPVQAAPQVQCNPNGKVHLLEEQLHALDVRIASVNEGWPQGSVVLMFAGVSFGPLMTVLGGLMIGLGAAAIPALLVPGIVVLVVGVVGVAMLVWGAMQASKASADARAEKAALMNERAKIEAELHAQPQASRASALPLLSLEF